HVLNLKKNKWTCLKTEVSPPPRRYHAVAVCGDEFFMFGGFNVDVIFNDMWVYNTRMNKWREIIPKNVPPSVRYGHSMVFHNSKLYVFGGSNANEFFDEHYVYDLIKNKWTRIYAGGSIKGRRFHRAVATD